MFIHLVVPGFHAAVHQAAHPMLRGRPSAVAVDAGEQAPLLAVSAEAWTAGVRAGIRAAAARAACPDLRLMTPEPDRYAQAQAGLAELAGGYSPCVGGRGGALDLDLAGTERLWTLSRRVAAPGDGDAACAQAVGLARELVRSVARRLHLPAVAGVARRLAVARLCARLARDPVHAGVVAAAPGRETELIDPLPLRWIADCSGEVARLFAAGGLATIGAARALGVERLHALAGDDAAGIVSVLAGEDETVIAGIAGAAPELSVGCRSADAAGASGRAADRLLAGLARDLAAALRARHLACTTLVFCGRGPDDTLSDAEHVAGRQLRDDADLTRLALELAGRRARRGPWRRLTLSARGLCAAEEQQALFDLPAEGLPPPPRTALRRNGDLLPPFEQVG